VRPGRPREPQLAAAILAAVIFALATSYQTTIRPDVRAELSALRASANTYRKDAIRAVVSPDEHILAEDPYVPVSLGQLPTVLDPFLFLRLANDHPQWRDDLIAQIEKRHFDKVVLEYKLDVNANWWKMIHFGEGVARAIGRNYRFVERVPSGAHFYYYVYVPRSETGLRT
jgi:hypothetical protein